MRGRGKGRAGGGRGRMEADVRHVWRLEHEVDDWAEGVGEPLCPVQVRDRRQQLAAHARLPEQRVELDLPLDEMTKRREQHRATAQHLEERRGDGLGLLAAGALGQLLQGQETRALIDRRVEKHVQERPLAGRRACRPRRLPARAGAGARAGVGVGVGGCAWLCVGVPGVGAPGIGVHGGIHVRGVGIHGGGVLSAGAGGVGGVGGGGRVGFTPAPRHLGVLLCAGIVGVAARNERGRAALLLLEHLRRVPAGKSRRWCCSSSSRRMYGPCQLTSSDQASFNLSPCPLCPSKPKVGVPAKSPLIPSKMAYNDDTYGELPVVSWREAPPASRVRWMNPPLNLPAFRGFFCCVHTEHSRA